MAVRKVPDAKHVCLLLRSSVWGGVELHTLALARALAARHHRVTIVEMGERVFENVSLGGDPPIELRAFSLDCSPEDVGLRTWLRLLRGLNADVGVFAKGWYFSASAAFDLAAWFAFGRYIVIEHLTPPPLELKALPLRRIAGIVPLPQIWRLRYWAQQWVRAFGPSRVIGVSRAVITQLQDAYDFPPAKLIAVPNGIDCERFRPSSSLRAEARKRWGIADGDVVFGTLARLDVSHKGQNLALECFAGLKARHPDARLKYVLVGDGPDRARLESEAAALGLGQSVIFAGGTTEPWTSHPGFDVFVLPSRYEGTPFALLEAMACGIAPVAMDVGGVGDVVNTPEVGWLVPAGDQAAFLDAMEAALDVGPEGWRRTGERARERVHAHFRADRQYSAVADLVLRS
jgi:glycosyltransferase involved in cell wall biosynthesis